MEYLAELTMQAVASAVAQEVVSRSVSSVLGKRKEKASQRELLYERLETAVYNISLALERAAKLPPVTEVSQLRRWANLKREYMEATNLFGKLHKKRKAQQQQETRQALVTHTSSSFSAPPNHHGRCCRWVPSPAALLSFVSSIVGQLNSKDDESLCLNRETVERFEWLANSANDFLKSVQSGCSLRRLMIFSGPLVSQLLERKTLWYKTAEGSRQQRGLVLCPVPLEERGIELCLYYHGCTDGEKSFELCVMLRLTESTDIIEVARKCLESLESLGPELKLVLAPIIGELTLLAGSPDFHAHPDPVICCSVSCHQKFQDEYTRRTQFCRPDPLCCSVSCLHQPCSNDMASSELSKMFPQEVICFGFSSVLSILPPDCRLLPRGHSSSDEAGTSVVMRYPPPLKLQLLTFFLPHDHMPPVPPVLVEGLQKEEGIAFHEDEIIKKGPKKCIIRQAAEKALDGLFRLQYLDISFKNIATMIGDDSHPLLQKLPKPPRFCKFRWFSKHGSAFFHGKIL